MQRVWATDDGTRRHPPKGKVYGDPSVRRQVRNMIESRRRDGWWEGLSDDEVRAIRADTRTTEVIGSDYDVSSTLITQIKQGRIYGHVDGPSGHRNPTGAQPSLTDDEVRAIRSDTRPHTEVARTYGVSTAAVYGIKIGRLYARVSGPPSGYQPGPARRLSDNDVRAIRKDRRPVRTIAQAYGVSSPTIEKVQKRIRYRDVK
jgi:hypothetical protein